MGSNKQPAQATAIIIAISLVVLLLLQGASVTGKAPSKPSIRPSPHAVYGYVYWPNGTLDTTVSLPVTITNNRTHQKGVVYVDIVPGGLPDGTYQVDLANVAFYPSGFLSTDIIYVNCTYTGMWAHNQTTAGGVMSTCNLRMVALPFGPKAIAKAAGGTVSSADGRISLEVPANSMPSDKVIWGLNTVNERHGALESLNMMPNGLTFAPSATLKWSYEGIDIGRIPAETLAVFTSDNGPWEKLPCYVDTLNKQVVAQVSHFSNFSLGGASVFGEQTGQIIVFPGTLDAPILDITLINSDLVADDMLEFMNIESNSTSDADIAGISIWNDLDDNQLIDGGDALIAGPLFAGSANFTLSVNIPADTTLNLLLTVDVSATAAANNLLDLRIPAFGVGLANAGLSEEAIDPAGNIMVGSNIADPHVVYGYVRNILGPLPNVWVNLTNNMTGMTENLMTDSLGRYDINIGLMPGGYSDGDEIFIVANDTLGQTGWNVTYVDVGYFGERCDIYIGKGPIASDETPANGSMIFDIYQNITVNITGNLAIDPGTIILEVEGVNYTWGDANLSFLNNTLTFNTSGTVGAWTDGQIVNATLWQANDTAGNSLQNSPYTWWFLVSLGVVEDAPDIRVHKAGADINITWAPIINATSYNIYRSLAVDGTGFNFTVPIGTVSELYFIDAGSLADGNNYSYIVRGNCVGGEGPKSNIGWKLRKQLVENAATTDINWIALPYNSDLKFAQDLINDLGGAANVNSISRWVASTQSYQNKLPVGGANWPITPGEGLLVNMKASIIYTIVGSYNNTTMISLIENAATTDINWIALPYHSQLKFAQDLITNLGGAANINSISRWVATTQSYQNKLPVGGANWPIIPGDAILVNVKLTITDYSMGPVQYP